MGHEIENCLKLAGFWNNLIDILERNELSVGYWRLNYISSVEFNKGKLNTFPSCTNWIFTIRSNKEHITIIDTLH
jgi:hypothetical protein